MMNETARKNLADALITDKENIVIINTGVVDLVGANMLANALQYISKIEDINVTVDEIDEEPTDPFALMEEDEEEMNKFLGMLEAYVALMRVRENLIDTLRARGNNVLALGQEEILLAMLFGDDGVEVLKHLIKMPCSDTEVVDHFMDYMNANV